MKIMWDLPRETHRYFIEYLSNQKHLKFILIKRFLRFLQQIEKSSKSAIKSLLSICKYDCRSTTGKNLRQLMLMCEKNTIDSIEENDFDCIEYFPVPEGETWRIGLLGELLDSRYRCADVDSYPAAIFLFFYHTVHSPFFLCLTNEIYNNNHLPGQIISGN